VAIFKCNINYQILVNMYKIVTHGNFKIIKIFLIDFHMAMVVTGGDVHNLMKCYFKLLMWLQSCHVAC
jgi:uncharacterized membrane protein